MTTIDQAAAELDIIQHVIVRALLGDPDPDPALYNTQTGEISKQGMEVLRERVTKPDEMRSAIMALVRGSAEKYQDALKATEKVLASRDEVIRAAVSYGCQRTTVAAIAGISRERLYQIIS